MSFMSTVYINFKKMYYTLRWNIQDVNKADANNHLENSDYFQTDSG